MSLIEVDSDRFEAASAVFGDNIGPQVYQAALTLSSSLSGCSAMAGSDGSGLTWSQSYDTTVQSVIAALTSVIGATYKMAELFERNGLNHGWAESSSVPGLDVPVTDTTSYVSPLNVCLIAPSAAGGSTSSPTGWSLIQSRLQGYLWPNGHQDLLRSASSAWAQIALVLKTASFTVSEASTAVENETSPEIADALRVTKAMGGHYGTVASGCTQLSEACEQYAGHIDQAHASIEHTLEILLGASAVTQVIGGFAAAFSFGFAEVPTQGAEGGEIATAASEIVGTLATLETEASTIAAAVTDAETVVADTDSSLTVIASANVYTADVEAAGALPSATEAEATSVEDLTANADSREATAAAKYVRPHDSIWNKGWKARGYEGEEKMGGWADNTPTIDKAPGGVATSIKTMDMTAKSYQSESRLFSTLKGYVNQIADYTGGRTPDGVLDEEDITGRALELGVEPGATSAAQRAVLDQIEKYAADKGVEFIVVEVT